RRARQTGRLPWPFRLPAEGQAESGSRSRLDNVAEIVVAADGARWKDDGVEGLKSQVEIAADRAAEGAHIVRPWEIAARLRLGDAVGSCGQAAEEVKAVRVSPLLQGDLMPVIGVPGQGDQHVGDPRIALRLIEDAVGVLIEVDEAGQARQRHALAADGPLL